MKISYRFEKKTIKKNAPLTGVRKPNKPARKKPKKKKVVKYSWKRVLLLVVLILVLEIGGSYAFDLPLVRSSITYILNPNEKLNTVKYETIKIAFADNIPENIKDSIKNSLKDIGMEDKKRFSFVQNGADLTIIYKKAPVLEDTTLYQSYLIPVGHSYWIRDDVSSKQIKSDGIYVNSKTLNLATSLLDKEIKIQEQGDLAKSLKNQEKITGLIDILDMDGQYKVLRLDGKYSLSNLPDGSFPYSLVITGKSSVGKNVITIHTSEILPKSFDKEKLLTVRMTGVTAITRSLGIKTNASKDPAYAARKIGSFLSQADLTHVSNEISFVKGCSPTGGVSFCSDTSYIKALRKSGVDIVELTGNHNNDKGSKYNTNSINMYKAEKWDYFGGGLNATDAAKILYKDVKGTKVAFIGYNYYDTILGTGAIATNSHAGANKWSTAKVTANVAEARKNADVVIVDFQFQECWAYTSDYSTNPACYKPLPSPDQKKVFRQAVDAGADIVVGTQAHQPQTYEIYKGKAIFYGLGNLYFDQIQWLGTRQGIILTHYMYDGKYLGTDLTTTIYNKDLLTYITTGSARTTLLKSLKKAR